jgi:hypothetical protein
VDFEEADSGVEGLVEVDLGVEDFEEVDLVVEWVVVDQVEDLSEELEQIE